MNIAIRQSAPQPARCAASCSSRADRDLAVAAVLASSREYFAIGAEPTEAGRAGAAAPRRR